MDLNDEPPLYEPPPSYDEVMKKEKEKMVRQSSAYVNLNGGATVKLPDSPPPPYKDDVKNAADVLSTWAPFSDNLDGAGPSSGPTEIKTPDELPGTSRRTFDLSLFRALLGIGEECDCEGACSCAVLRRGSQPATWSPASSKLGALDNLLHTIHTQGQQFDPKACVKGSMSADNIYRSECT